MIHQSVFIYNEKFLFIEFSVPKIIYGQNIFLAYPSQLEPTVIKVKENVERELKIKLVSYDRWIIQRLDLCYSWKFNTQAEAYIALRTLDGYDYSRKKKAIRDTSIEYLGSAYKVKFYLKKEEYLAHDLKRLIKIDDIYAQELIHTASGVLRFEVSIKKETLNNSLKFNLHINDITDEYCIDNLNKYLSKLIGNNNRKTLDYLAVTKLLFGKYTKQKASDLLEFYNLYFNPNKKIRDFNRRYILKQSNRSTIYRKKKALRDIGIGIKKLESRGIDFDLCIPNKNVIIDEKNAILEMMKGIFEIESNTPVAWGQVKCLEFRSSQGLSEAPLDDNQPKRLLVEGETHSVSTS